MSDVELDEVVDRTATNPEPASPDATAPLLPDTGDPVLPPIPPPKKGMTLSGLVASTLVMRKKRNKQQTSLQANVFLVDLHTRSKQVKSTMSRLTPWKRYTRQLSFVIASLRLERILYTLDPMKGAIKTIGAKYGSTVLGYFNLARWIVGLNFFLWVFWLGFAIVPWFKYWEGEGWRDADGDHVIDATDVILNIFGANANGRETDKTWFFYSGYLNTFGSYEMGSVYVVLVIGTFAVALFLIVVEIGRRLSQVSSQTSMESLQLPVVCYSWDWAIQDEEASEEMLQATWIQVQGEYFETMRRKGLQSGDTVDVFYGKWMKGELVELESEQASVILFESRETVKVSVNNVRPETVCLGLRPAQLRRYGGNLLSLMLCVASIVIMYFCIKYKSDLDDKFTFTSSLVITAVNGVIPFVQKSIVALEALEDPNEVIRQEVIRVFFIKIFNAAALYLSMKDVEENSGKEQCPEFLIGTMFEQLLIVDMVTNVVTSVAGGFVMFKRFGRQQFAVSNEIINALYRQCITWIGCPYSPMLLLISALTNVIIFFIKKAVMFATCRTPDKPVSSEGTSAFFQTLLLVTLLVTYIPAFSFLNTEKLYCGPHYNAKCNPDTLEGCETPLTSLNLFVQELGIQPATRWIFSTIVLFALVVLLLISSYFLVMTWMAEKDRSEKRSDELVTEIKDLRDEIQEMYRRLQSAQSNGQQAAQVADEVPLGTASEKRKEAISSDREVAMIVRRAMKQKLHNMILTETEQEEPVNDDELVGMLSQVAHTTESEGKVHVEALSIRPYLDMQALKRKSTMSPKPLSPLCEENLPDNIDM
eukprot:Sspe_Gene.79398::Locus_49792_Transcript_1_1_Confidence_1.000_Length_2498::g.79398::m.79398/K21988/TMC; transmembrane channel-like protein